MDKEKYKLRLEIFAKDNRIAEVNEILNSIIVNPAIYNITLDDILEELRFDIVSTSVNDNNTLNMRYIKSSMNQLEISFEIVNSDSIYLIRDVTNTFVNIHDSYKVDGKEFINIRLCDILENRYGFNKDEVLIISDKLIVEYINQQSIVNKITL